MRKTTKSAQKWPITQTKKKERIYENPYFWRGVSPAHERTSNRFHKIDSAHVSAMAIQLQLRWRPRPKLWSSFVWPLRGSVAGRERSPGSQREPPSNSVIERGGKIATSRFFYSNHMVVEMKATHAKVRHLDGVFSVTLPEFFQFLDQIRVIV